MTTQNIGLFKAIAAKMGFLDKRQSVIAQNVANADTPSYQARDLAPVDFSRVLDKATGAKKTARIETTHPMHMPSHNEVASPENKAQKITYEVAPAGNAVILEEQMLKSSQTSMDFNLMTTLYQKNMAMLRMAIGQ
jgi:flagellar basal-body rod protein FlgB